MAIQNIPNVDFSIIAEHYEGQWLLVRVGGNQTVVANASTPEAALNARPDLDNDPMVILTKAPAHIPLAAALRIAKDES